jgi:preprotein translocase subunit SecF
MASFAKFGNDLYTGERSYNFVGRRRIWYTIGIVLIALSIILPALRGGFVFGIDFTGGSQFQVTDISGTPDQNLATDAVTSTVPGSNPRVTTVGTDGVRVQTDQLSAAKANAVRDALATAYKIPIKQVNSSYIGPSWGGDITASAIRALIVFLVLAAVFMASAPGRCRSPRSPPCCTTFSSRPVSTAPSGLRSRRLRSSGS